MAEDGLVNFNRGNQMFLNNRIADKISTFRASLADLPSLPPPTPSCPNNSKTDDFVKHYSF
ncbi:hypothetical protein ABTN36_18105, partial [Acinetobacter baumannii]